MRIIAGQLGGRQFVAPDGHRTHPMSEKMRGAIFNALGDIDGLTVLDAYAGSGALAFEALSRGATNALLLERDIDAAETITANITALGLKDQAHLTLAPVTSWSDNNHGQSFDLVFADPPYDHISLGTLQRLVKHVNQTGVMILSWPGDQKAPFLDGLEVAHQKSYGDSQLVFYRRIE